jgi:glycosyltransferase involved in cell wall biosynthesis
MARQDPLLHAERLTRTPLAGKIMRSALVARIGELRRAAHGRADPGVTVLIRTRNDARRLEGLCQDVAAQDYDGPVQLVVVDTESSDNTLAIARQYGAHIITIKQQDFSYPYALNVGFEAAKHPFVLTLVGHSSLTNRYVLKTASRHTTDTHFGGAYGMTLADTNATVIERLAISLLAIRDLGRPTNPA